MGLQCQVLHQQYGLPQGDSPGAWPLVGEKRYSKAWLGPISGLQSGSLPSLSRQGSQVPLLQLDKLQSEVTRSTCLKRA